MPGPLLNISVFISAILDYGVVRPLLLSSCALLGLYLPSFLMLMMILPNLHVYRRQKKIRTIFRNMLPTSIGLLLGLNIILLKSCLAMRREDSWYFWVCMIIGLSFVLLRKNVHRALVFFIGNCLYLLVKN